MGVAATFTLEASRFDPGVLSLAAGVAAAEAVGQALASVGGRVGLKWPNDVVAWVGEHRPDRPPKIAGCLVEVKGGVALAGIGINVRQQAEDFPPEWTDRCTSLAMLGSTEDSIDVIERLVPSLDAALTLPRDVLAEAWRRRDVLVGTVRTVEYDGVRHRGLVESIDPFACLRLATPTGPIDLPARGASVVWE
jgi:biotin-(acetyl-CoA carboxylase) ligase